MIWHHAYRVLYRHQADLPYRITAASRYLVSARFKIAHALYEILECHELISASDFEMPIIANLMSRGFRRKDDDYHLAGQLKVSFRYCQ